IRDFRVTGVQTCALPICTVGADGQQWLVDPSWAMFSVTLASVWKVAPFVMLVVLAALQGVPDELLEAARVDGADALNRIRNVVLDRKSTRLNSSHVKISY